MNWLLRVHMLLWCILICAFKGESTGLDLNTRSQLVFDLSYVPDSASQLTIDDILDSAFQTNFIPNTPQTKVNPAIQTYWVSFDLENTTSETNTWILEYPGWEFVDMYVVKANGTMDHKMAGHYQPYPKRDYPVANRNYIQLLLHAGEKIHCYTRLNCTRTNVEQFPANLGYYVSLQKYQIREDSTIRSAISMFVGILLIMFAFNLFVYFSTRDKNYFWYLGTVLCIAYLTANNSGYLHEIFGGWGPFIKLRVPVVLAVVVLLVYFSLNFTRSFLDVRSRYKTWSKIFNVLIGLAVGAYLLTFVQFEMGWNISNLVNLLTVLSIVIVAIKSVLKNYPGAKIFLLANGVNMLGSFVLLFALVGILPYNVYTGNLSLPTGSTLEAVLFSFALANRINILKREKEQSQQNALELAQENERIVRDQNEILEKKVVERTAEIRRQTAQIVEQKELIEQEKENSDRLLMNILPKATAEELKANGRATPRYYESASILFTDVKDFTKIAETLTSEQLVRDLDYCFQHFDEITANHNLEKIKTIGDAYMCVGGIPIPNKTHAEDCVSAALEMQHFLSEWREEQIRRGEQPWNVRIGIHTGPITAGVVGKKKFAYDIWGDTVNLAARMESSGEVDKVNISEDTWKLVHDKFRCENRGNIEAKNKGKVNMYFVYDQLAEV